MVKIKREAVFDGKGQCFSIGPVEVIVGGSLYRFSIAFGKALVILVGER